MTRELTFGDLRYANETRCRQWHPGFPKDGGWTTGDWANAMQGEVGEVLEVVMEMSIAAGRASNFIKKLRRYEEDLRGVGDPSIDQLRSNVAKEVADVVTYGDLLLARLGISLNDAVIDKFNEVSVRQGFEDRL